MANNSIKLTKYVLDILKNDEELNTLMSTDNIFPVDARLSTKFPFCVVVRTGIRPARTKDGMFEDIISFSIIIVDDTYIGSINIANCIRNILDNSAYRTDEVKINMFELTNSTENIYNDTYLQQLDFDAHFDITC